MSKKEKLRSKQKFCAVRVMFVHHIFVALGFWPQNQTLTFPLDSLGPIASTSLVVLVQMVSGKKTKQKPNPMLVLAYLV